MIKISAVALLVGFAWVGVSAQGDISSAPVVWERYKISNTKISVMFPKLPTAVHRSDPCSQFVKNSYFAYAEGAVYELTVVEKASTKIPQYCSARVPFGNNTLAARLTELRNDKDKSVETSEFKGDNQVNKFAADGSTRWVIDDIKNSRWVELAVASRPDSKAGEDKFTASLDLSSDEGKQVGLGSDRTLGDAGLKPAPVKDPPQTLVTEPIRMIVIPRASYTEEARTKKIQGSVRLKVTLLANGGIGTIEVINSLEGLDDQAIAAARKIAFLPQRVNGVPISVIKTLEYGFSIY